MRLPFLISRRVLQRATLLWTRLFAASLGLFLAAADPRAHASTLSLVPDCSASGNSLKCYLSEFLSFLYIAAGILAFVLIVVAVLAIHSYRKKQQGDIDS